jgi:uncharacterized membrane protein YfcA
MTAFAIAMGVAAAILTGFAKSGLPGAGILGVPLMAMAFPARASVAALLPILIAGDILAIVQYRRHADWPKLLRLFPWVAIGMAAAFFLLGRIDDAVLKPVLGGLVLAMIALELARRRRDWRGLTHHPVFTGAAGALGGLATTLGNAAGPIMNLYFLGRDLPKKELVGTAAWFFFVVNLTKVPLFAARGMFTREGLLLDAVAAPAVVIGALAGRWLLARLPQEWFYRLVLALSAVAAVNLMV